MSKSGTLDFPVTHNELLSTQLDALRAIVESRRAGTLLSIAFVRNSRRRSQSYGREVRKKVLDPLGVAAAKAYTSSGVHKDVVSESKFLSEKEQEFVPWTVVDRVISELTGVGAIDTARNTLHWVFQNWYARVGEQTVGMVNHYFDVGIGLTDARMNRVVATGGRRAGLVDFTKETRQALFHALSQTRNEQLGAIDAARKVRHMVPAGRFVNAGARYRAELIARTEILHAQRVSSLEAYRDADTIEQVQANDALIGDTDEHCEERDGQLLSFDDAEVEMDNTHPNCTLNFTPIVTQVGG